MTDDLRLWLEGLAAIEASIPARVVLGRLPDPADTPDLADTSTTETEKRTPSWRELLWTVPSETRLGVHEVAEAVGRSRSWVYKRTQRDADPMLPHRKLDGSLVFTAGELRTWIREHENAIHAVPMTPPARGGLSLRRAS